MLRSNEDDLMGIFDPLLETKQDVNIILVADAGDCRTASANDVWMMVAGNVKFPGLTETRNLQLLKALKECPFSFLTITKWTFHKEKGLVVEKDGKYDHNIVFVAYGAYVLKTLLDVHL